MSEISFERRVAIVTGAGRGIGRFYALELARRGAAVVVNDIGGVGTSEGSRAEAVAAEIRAAGGQAIASHDNVGSPSGGEALTAAAREHFGTIDIVINNAGFLRRALFEDLSSDDIAQVINVHLLGAFYVTQPAWKIMLKQRYGRVVLTSSSCVFGMGGNSNYVAAKAGLLGMMAGLAAEGEAFGIKVNSILPFAKSMITVDSPAIGPDASKNVPLQKALEPRLTAETCSAAALYLCSEDCNLNGEAISTLAGRYARSFRALTKGWLRPDVAGICPEDIRDHISDITDSAEIIEPRAMTEELQSTLNRVRAAETEHHAAFATSSL